MKHEYNWENIAKYLSGESTEEEERALRIWMQESKDNLQLFKEIEQNWSDKKRKESPELLIRGKNRVFEKIANDKREKGSAGYNPKWKIRAKYFGQLAAALIICAIGFYWYASDERTHAEMVRAKVVENIGPPREVVLPDGSRVWLNAASNIRYPETFLSDTREIYLEGEAFFEVQRDEERPFIVHTEGISTRVLGTSFNIRAYPEQADIEVTVASGKVSVADSTGVIGELIKDQQIAYQKSSGRSTRQLVANQQMQQWKNGQLIFDSEPFGDVAQILARRFQVEITFQNIDIKRCPVTARFDGQESLEQILYMLCLVSESEHEFKSEKRVLISGKGCIRSPNQ
ncbi:FecR family protein [Dyadobacter tibetensis]|uniref:FecR family protein n=1 Tax=Dyadobacter tibetensis TaxID=1211851 RepID=UPI0004720F07|nr:FecR domain-containing protein [Dyadobacter tibetensis]